MKSLYVSFRSFTALGGEGFGSKILRDTAEPRSAGDVEKLTDRLDRLVGGTTTILFWRELTD